MWPNNISNAASLRNCLSGWNLVCTKNYGCDRTYHDSFSWEEIWLELGLLLVEFVVLLGQDINLMKTHCFWIFLW